MKITIIIIIQDACGAYFTSLITIIGIIISETCSLSKSITVEDMPDIRGKAFCIELKKQNPSWQHGKKLSATGKSHPKSSNEGSHTKNSSEESIHLETSHKFVKFKECETMDYSGQKHATSEALHLEKSDGKITEASLEQNLFEAKKLNRDTRIKSKRHHGDVLDALGVEKDLLMKFLLDIDVCEDNLQVAFKNKSRLTKSGSVPQPSSQIRSTSPVFLEHKQKEIWPFHKGGKLLDDDAQAQKIFASYVKPMAMGSDFGVCRAVKLKHGQNSSSSSSSKGWNQLVLHRFKVIKKKIKHAITEFKKSGYQTSIEAIHHRASSEHNRSTDETKASKYDSSIDEARRMKRASSLNESLDRYTQLFEQSFNKDIKWHNSKSKSLKLPNEDKSNKSVCPPKASRRNLSLPNFDSFGLFILHEALSDANDSGMTAEETDIRVHRKSESIPLNRDISLDDIADTEMEETTDSISSDVKPSLLSDETNEPALEDGSFIPQEQVEISMATYPSMEALETLETSFENNKTCNAEAGRESNARGSNMDELESELPNRGSVHSLPCSLHNTDATEKGTEQIKSDTNIDSNFKYVKEVVESLDFKRNNEDIQLWHILDFNGSWGHEIEFSVEEETLKTYNHHILLSNLVKEVLLQIHEASPSYFPSRNFSFNKCISPMHNKGNHLVNEVWNRVKSYLSLRPELDQTLDDVVGRDMAKNSGWMNLQYEEECVALALEEMIIKDLLDEIIIT